MYMLKGIDISSYQGLPDFARVKKAVDFVIIKATEGVGFKDPRCERNQSECRNKGIPLGYYHFARPDLGNPPEKEASWFLQAIGELKDGEMLFLDFEVSFDDRVNWCKSWLDHVYRLTNVKAPIYLNKSLEKGANWKPVIDGNYGLWLADYTHDPNSAIPQTQWPVMALRQYTNREPVDGIFSGGVDGNVFYGDFEALKAYGYKGTSSEPSTCEKDLADCKHKLSSKADEITELEKTITDMSKNFGILETQYKASLSQIREKDGKIAELNTEIERLKSQKFELSEIIKFFFVWLGTGGDSKNG